MDRVVAQTARLVVRPWRHEQAARLLELLSRVDVLRWLEAEVPEPMRTLEEAHDRIEAYHRRSRASDLGFWAVEVRATGTVVGTVLLSTLPDAEHGEVEIGWQLHPDSHSQGYAREAAAAVLAHGFAIGLPEVWACTHVDNYPSQRVARAIGMEELGIAERWYPGPSRFFRAAATPR